MDAVAGVLKDFLRSRIRNAEIRIKAETITTNHRHIYCFKQVLHEVVTGVYGFAVLGFFADYAGAIRINIECAFRCSA